jgi:nucleotide-binding universal stress UspA family protein
MYKRILAGTDLSKTAGVATDRAAKLADRLGAELILVHAGRDPGAPLKELAESYGAEAVVAEGPPADVLIAEADAREADLLVVGSVGMSGAKRFMLGNVPNKVSHHASRDLLIVKTDPPPRNVGDYKKILVGTDGSPTAMRAVDAAAKLGKALGADVTVVCAYQPPTEQELSRMRSDPNDPVAQWHASRSTADTPSEFRWRIAGASHAEDVLERAQEHAAAQGVEAEVRAVDGPAAEVLLGIAESEGFDVIAVGSVGMSGSKRLMLGNVPHRISHHAPTDVLILKTS